MTSVATYFKRPRLQNFRAFHASATAVYPRQQPGRAAVGSGPPPSLSRTGRLTIESLHEDDIPYEERANLGSSSAGHILLQNQRQMLKYMRLIEHDMPRLVQFREEFVPPSSGRPLVVRTIDYCGEEHPATAKRSAVVAVRHLPLRDEVARHAIKLLAGPRWSPHPPSDSSIATNEGSDNHGYIKISCEDFPQPGMNLKWISDVLDRLIDEANMNGSRFSRLPLDKRHIDARIRKAKGKSNPSIRDFPQEWLPSPF